MKIETLKGDTAKTPKAVELFQGEEKVRGYVIQAIRESRVNENLRPFQLAERAGLEDPQLVYQIEAGNAPMDLNVVQSLMAALELPIDSALPDPQFKSPQQRQEWISLMRRAGSGTGCGGGLDEAVALSVFIRLKALQEICA